MYYCLNFYFGCMVKILVKIESLLSTIHKCFFHVFSNT